MGHADKDKLDLPFPDAPGGPPVGDPPSGESSKEDPAPSSSER